MKDTRDNFVLCAHCDTREPIPASLGLPPRWTFDREARAICPECAQKKGKT